MKNGLLVASKEDFVKAEISNHKEKNACKVRLKGDLSDHWSGEKFFSSSRNERRRTFQRHE